MNKFSASIALVLAFVLFAGACGSDDGNDVSAGAEPTTGAVAEPAPTNEQEESEVNESTERLWIGPQLAECVGVAPQKCMQIRRTADGQVEYFYDQIDGFTHEAGTTYVVDVAVTEIENPPADGSSLQYRLIEIVESSSEAATAGIDGTSWTLLGFRDGDLFDPVAENVEITITFDGERVNGSAGCNNYMGSFTADGAALTFGPLAGTKMLCPPDVMAFEDRFLPLLGAVETAEMMFDGTLVLAPISGQTLVFAPA